MNAFRFIQSDAKPRTPKPSFGVRTACLRFHRGLHKVPRMSRGAACCNNLSTSSILVSQRHRGRASKLTPPGHAKELTHREQSGSKQPHSKMTQPVGRAEDSRSVGVLLWDRPGGGLTNLEWAFQIRRSFYFSKVGEGEGAFLALVNAFRFIQSDAKPRTPKSSLGVRTACLRFHRGLQSSLACREG